MKKFVPLLLLLNAPAEAGLTPMADSELEGVNGQAGVTLETGLKMSIGEITYNDDGNRLQMQDIHAGSQADINQTALITRQVDVDSDGKLHIQSQVSPTTYSVGAVRINDSAASFGQLQLNYSGQSNLVLGAPSGDDYIEGSFYTQISGAELIWTTNGHSMSFDNIGYEATINNLAIGQAWDGSREGLNFNLDQFSYAFSTGGMKLGGVSLGTLEGSLALSGNMELYGGGRYGSQGMSMNASISILTDPANYVRFTDDGNSLLMGDFNGSLNVHNLTFDVMNDHLLLAVDQLDGSFNTNRILIGDSTRPVGAVQLDFLFADGNGYSNQLQLYPGIVTPDYAAQPAAISSYAQNFYAGLNSGSDGLSAAVQWNLANAEAAYIDDGRMVVVSGIRGYGSGNLSLDVRSFDHDNNPATADKTALALGLNRFSGSYSIDGLRVGTKNAPLQGGAELLLSLEVFQAMDFNLDGYTLITAGGSSGGGIQIDGDYLFSDSNIGLSVDENGDGIWATGVNYDIHLRGIQVDVSNTGVSINRTEQWSTMDVDNMRWGDRNTGTSLGRIVLERFEKGSSLTINPGGSGAVCVGASAADAVSCSSAGGRWEDRGDEGITVALKAAFAPEGPTSDGSIARNRLTWENNRDTDGSGNSVNGTGTQIIFDGYSTNDGLGTTDTNDYGFQANLKIDVYETKVLKKTDGTDDNGVTGSKGDELIYDDSSRTTYAYVTTPTTAQELLRPLGFAVQGNVSFKDFQVDAVQLRHPAGGVETVFSGIVMQNFDVTTNLTATPIR